MLLNDRNLLLEVNEKVDVLIVEDEPTARRAMRTLVASRGYRTAAVCSGEDALLSIAGGSMPRVALVDLDLPGMSGIELIRRLALINPDIFPVLITAAARDVVDRLAGAAFDALHGSPDHISMVYFQKPVDFDQLMTILNSRQSVT